MQVLGTIITVLALTAIAAGIMLILGRFYTPHDHPSPQKKADNKK